MKKTAIVLCASLLAALAIVSPVLAKDPPASAEQLRSELESALKAKDTNAVLSLVNWEGVSDKMKSSQIMMLGGLLKEDVQSVTLGPVPASSKLTFEWNGVRYSPNVSVVGFVEIKFAQNKFNHTASIPYGKTGTSFYVPGTKEEKAALPTKEKSLSIMVVGSNLTKTATFTGAYIYVKDGQEIKETLSSNGSVALSGDYIKSCRVQLTSEGNGPIQLVITEAGKKIFESKKVGAKEPMIYEDGIDQLVVKLSASHGLWVNGMSPTLGLPASASTDQALARVFEMMEFDRGRVTVHQTVTIRKVEIAGGSAGLYTAALLDTNLGRKIVLLRHEGEAAGWWCRVYDAEPAS